METATYCYACKKSLNLAKGIQISRYEECPNCRVSVRVCKNCLYFDLKAHNECRETQAERILDKEKANFCEFFSLKFLNQGDEKSSKSSNTESDIKSKFDALFK